MDILVSSNFERLLWYLAYETARGMDDKSKRNEASETVSNWMGKMKTDGRVEVPSAVLNLARRDFIAERISDEQVWHPSYLCQYWLNQNFPTQTLDTIRLQFSAKYSYILDPHTAVGLAAARLVAPLR